MLKGSLLHSVAGRVTAFTALGAAAIGATLGLFFAANVKLKSANEDNARAAAISAASFDLRAHVIELDDAFQAVIARKAAMRARALARGRALLAGARADPRAGRRAERSRRAARAAAPRGDRVLPLRLRRGP